MDVDGDQILATDEELIIKSLPKRSYMLYDEGMDSLKLDNNWESRTKYFCGTAKVSQVGLITNLASVHRDLSLHNNNSEINDLKVVALRFIQGWEIDSAKTGNDVVIPKDLLTDAIPHWLHAKKIACKRTISKDAQVYHSTSPCGVLYDYVTEFIKDFKITTQYEDKTFKFIKNVNKAEVIRISPIVKEYESQYVRDMAVVYEKYSTEDTDDRDIKEQMNNDYNEVYSKYAALLNTISSDETAVACAVYDSAYNQKKNSDSSCSMPWNVCFNGMMKLLHANNNATRLVEIPSKHEIPTSVIVSNSGMLYVNDCPVKIINCIAGVYEVISLDRSYFIKAKVSKTIEVEPLKSTRYLNNSIFYQFKMNGFKHLGLTPVDSLNIIKENNDEFMLVGVNDRAMMVSGNKVIGYYNKESNFILPEVVNVKFKLFSNEEPIYVPKKPNSKTIMIDEVNAYRGSLTLTAKPISGITEDEFKEIAILTQADITEEYVGMEYVECEEDECIYYSADDDSSMVVMEEYTEIEQTTAVSFDVVEVDNGISADILAKVNTKEEYWISCKDIIAPTSVSKYNLSITNFNNFKPGTQVATITSYTNQNVPYNFEVCISNIAGVGLEVRSDIKVSLAFKHWLLRLVSYKATEMRIKNS